MKTRRQLLVALGAGLLAVPLSALAQPKGKVWRVGVLATRNRPEKPQDWETFEKGWAQFPRRLKELGYVEGTSLVIEWRYAAGDYSRLPGLAAELVGLGLDALVTDGSPGISAAQGATKTIPIVFYGGTDLVASGFVKSLARPGGNTTGVSLLLPDSVGKQLELLNAMVPKLSRLAILTNSSTVSHPTLLALFRKAAEASGIQIVAVAARTSKEIESAVAEAARERAGALLWVVDTFLLQNQRLIAELALRHRLPSMSGTTDYPACGGLMSYGPDRSALMRRLADYVDKVFKGASPGELPVEQPMKLDLIINRTTARTLGLEIPAELLVLAEKVIE